MKAGDLVKSHDGGSLVLVLEVAHALGGGTAVRILLNDGRRIWVGAGLLEIVNATG